MHILVVDNNVELCRALQDYFETQDDIDVVGVAYDGEEALEKIERLQPDVILLDITMPYLDGLGVMERLGSPKIEKKPKVVAMTAFSTDTLLTRLMSLGVDYFVVKPFRLEILAQRLREFTQDGKGMKVLEAASTLDVHLGIEQRVTKLLHAMGVPPHYKGFSYLKEAVLMCTDDGYISGALTKDIYPKLATKYHSSPSGVEAAIRNAVVAAWEHGNTDYIRELCQPYCGERMPTNALIIAKIAEKTKASDEQIQL